MSTQDRTQDRYAYRTGARHERAGGISTHRAKSIRRMHADGVSQSEIARELGISRSAVRRVLSVCAACNGSGVEDDGDHACSQCGGSGE